MAYDTARAVTVLFGGFGSSITPGYYTDTWEWNGTAWTQRVVSGPSARAYTAMAYDATRGVTVLFGGIGSTANYFGDTWEWNGVSWTQRVVAGPSSRYGHTMVYDAARGVTVLFGGNSPSGLVGDTWEWNGAAWTQRAVTGPAPRRWHAMAYDATRALTLMVGGEYQDTNSFHCSSNACESDTWQWDGAGAGSWTRLDIGAPSLRAQHAMAYDAAHRCAVLFGGQASFPAGTQLADTWLTCNGPTVNTHPTAQAVCNGAAVSFTAAAVGTGAVTYQWRKNGANISGATTSSYSIGVVSPSDVGSYDCVASDSCTSTPTNPAGLDVYCSCPQLDTYPWIVAQPEGDLHHCATTAVIFSATANSSGTPFTFQWQKNSVNISGANAASYTIDPATQGDSGSYPCIVTNTCGTVTSEAAVLAVYSCECGSADFNGDGDVGTDADLEAFFACLAGNCCGSCWFADFNGNGDIGTDKDLESFFSVLAGGPCVYPD